MKRFADDNALGLLQYLSANLVARGYVRHLHTRLPEGKAERWSTIMDKICKKYVNARGDAIFNLSRDQRARRKREGLLNAVLLSWRDNLYLLATDGRDDVGLLEGETLRPWPSSRIVVPASANFTYEILRRQGKTTVALTRDCFVAKIAFFEDHALHANLDEVLQAFSFDDRLIPAYAGCLTQKRKLVNQILRSARTAGKRWDRDAFTITAKRPHVR